MALCSGIRADGGRCKAQAMRNSEWCINHHPDHEQARRRRASKGGKRGGRGRPQAELSDIKRRLLSLADDVLAGAVDRSNAAVVGQLLNTYLSAVRTELKVREVEELARQVEELRTIIDMNTDRNRSA
jgi:hypothetical protein